MKKKLYFSIVFCLFHILLSAQEWNINYHGAHPSGKTHFRDGFIDGDGVTFFAGQEGPNADTPDALFMRIEPNGDYSTFIYKKEGFHSRATCILEMQDHNLFVAGNLYGDSADYVMVLILDKQLNLLEERQYEKEVEAYSFGLCKAALDSHGNIIVSTTVLQDNGTIGTYDHGVFYKFDHHGDTIRHRYLIEDYPSPLYYFMDFHVRQMWYDADEETLLCLAPGFGNVPSFITFDSAFNYIEEYPIWRDDPEKSDHTLSQDCFTDHWYSKDEALFFSSFGDYHRNKLRVSRINTHGEYLEYIHLNERTDTIDDPAAPRCMATANDSTFYFSFFYHVWETYPGIACIYMLNEHLEIIGRHLDDEHDRYRSNIILPTADGGCISVIDSCNYGLSASESHPIIKKLKREDFELIPCSVTQNDHRPSRLGAYPNPCEGMLHIPLPSMDGTGIRCQVIDNLGRTIANRMVPPSGGTLDLDVSRLKPGIYSYRIYSDQGTLLTERFIKK